MEPDDLSLASQVFDFLQQYLEDRDAGEVKSLSHYLSRFPASEREIAREYLRLTADDAGRTPPDPGTTTSGAGAARPSGRPAPAGAPVPTTVAGDPPEVGAEDPRHGLLGHYRLLSELGRGGQAVVHLAEDTALGRLVALKIIQTPWGRPPAARLARLRREVEALSRLDHPNIATVYDADLSGPVPWVAMRHVAGSTLAELMAARDHPEPSEVPPMPPRGRRDVRRLVALFETLARGLHAAHEEGVVHRDIKPGNIMVDREGRPVILDFGLARLETAADHAALTRTHETFGTPAYMSPEQIASSGSTLDRRTDLYSLGVTLYEALTGRRPHQGGSRSRLERAIATEPVPDPARSNPAVDDDLRVVLETVLAKERHLRYATALDFAEDLRRVRLYEPIVARPAGPWVRFRRWTQRSPALASTVLVLAGTLLVGFVWSVVLLDRVARERDLKDAALDEVRRTLSRVEAHSLANQALVALDDDPGLTLLLGLASAERERTYAGNNALLAGLVHGRLERLVADGEPPPTHAALAPDGRLLGTTHDDGAARVWDIASGDLVASLGPHEGPVQCVAFGPGSDVVATGGDDGRLVLWTLPGGERRRACAPHDAPVRAVLFLPGGDRLAAGDADGLLAVHPVDGGSPLRLEGHVSPVTGLAVSPDGRLLASWSALLPEDGGPPDRAARLWRVDDGTLQAVADGHDDRIPAVAFSPDGALLATASYDATVALRDATTGEAQRILRHPGKPFAVAFSPDGRRLLVGFEGHAGVAQATGAWLWDVASGDLERALSGHVTRTVFTVAFAPDGRRCVTGSYDATAHLWDVGSGRLLEVLKGRSRRLSHLLWSDDGDRLVTVSRYDSASVWRLGDDPDVLTLDGHDGPVVDADFGPSGELLATASEDGTAALWDVSDGGLLVHRLPHDGEPVRSVDVHPGGGCLVTSSGGGATVWSTADGTPLAREARAVEGQPVAEARFSPNGRTVLVRADAALVQVRETVGLRAGPILRGHRRDVVAALFTPDGQRIVTGSSDGTIRLWDAATGSELAVLERWEDDVPRRMRRVQHLALRPDGGAVLAATGDLHLRVWRLADGRCTWDSGAASRFGLATFAGDEAILSTSPLHGGLARWNLADGSRLPVTGHASPITCLAVDASGRYALTTSSDHTARLWRLDDDGLAAWMDLAGHGEALTFGAFSPDGSRLVTTSRDGTARLWPVDPLGLARSRRPRDVTATEREQYLER